MLIRLSLLILTAFLVAVPAEAKKVTVKLATMAPDGSAWDAALKDMREDWDARTDGRVKLRIYPGGVAGDDKDMVRKMRIGQLHAAAITSTGLAAIDDAFTVFGIPMFFETPEEFQYVLKGMTPFLKEKLESNGFHLLHWGNAGWAHLFTNKPVSTVAQVRKTKMFVWAGDDRVVEVWKETGFTPVPLAATDVVVSLQTGLIEGIPTTPYATVAMQWYRHTKYMMGLGLGPLMGATIVSDKTWKKISDEDKVQLLESAAQAAIDVEQKIPDLDREAVAAMEARGVTVIPVEPAAVADWQAASDDFAVAMRKSFVPEDAYQLALRFRTEYRNQQAGGGAN